MSEFIEPWPEAPRSILACITTGADLDRKTFPPLAWTVPGIIPEGFGLLVGAPKVGKSWLALGIGLALSTGTTALGGIDVGPPRRVLYLALEDGERRLQGRCRTLLGEGVAIPDALHVATRLPEGVSVLALIAEWLDAYRDDDPLVLLDTLGKVMPPAAPGESAYARDYRIGGQLKRLTDDHPGATLLVVHHNRKQTSGDWMDDTSGTQGLNGAADFTVVLARDRNTTDAILKVTGRDVPEAEYAMTADAGTWSLAGGSLVEAESAARTIAATAGVGDTSAAVVEYVHQHPEGVRAAEVAEALGMPEARRYLARLSDAGRITKAGRGLYAPPITTVPTVPTVPSERISDGNGTDGTVGTPPLSPARSLHTAESTSPSPAGVRPTPPAGSTCPTCAESWTDRGGLARCRDNHLPRS